MVIAALIASTLGWAIRPPDASVATTGGSRDVTCHAIPGGEAQCSVVLDAIDEAWAAQVEQLGFRPPLPDGTLGGGPGLDVYLSHLGTGGAGGAYVTCDDEPCVDAAQGDGRASTPSYIVIDPELDDTTLRRYCHHEFNHVLQFATDFEEPFLDAWEGTATAAETWTDPASLLDQGPLADYQATPWVSAVLQDGYWLDEQYDIWSYYEYGAVLWVLWMDQRWGDGAGSIGPALWAAMANDPGANEPDLLDAWDELSGGWENDVVEFAVDRGRFGTKDEPEWLTALGGAPEVTTTLIPPGDYSDQLGPMYPLGMHYIDIEVAESANGSVRVGSDIADLELVSVRADPSLTLTQTSSGRIVFAGLGTMRLVVVSVPENRFDADESLEPASPYLTVFYDKSVGQADCQPDGVHCGGFALMIGAFPAALWARRRRQAG